MVLIGAWYLGLAGPARSTAHACGGGLVTVTGGSLGQDTQRILVSFHDGQSDVITQVGVPSTTADYGVLIPVAGTPTLDPTPVPSAEFDSLVRSTEPQIHRALGGGDGDDGCGCASKSGGSNGGTPAGNGADGGGLSVTQPVTIGPVSAVVLSGGEPEAVNDWLGEHGFAIASADRPTVEAYAGEGRSFIALRRADNAASIAASSVGIHFSVPGDQRALPLRFIRMGAAATVSFTVFLVGDTPVGPASPFEAVTLDELSAATLRSGTYATAVAAAVAERRYQAFVVEGSWSVAELADAVGPSLQSLFRSGQHVTRLSTILPATALTTDVALNEKLATSPPRVRYVRGEPADGRTRGWTLGLIAMAVAASFRRRRPRVDGNS